MPRNQILSLLAAEGMIAQNIHGLLAKRTGKGFRVDREAKQASHSGDEDLWRHDRVLAVSGGGESGDPRIGVFAVKPLEALLVARGALGNQAVQNRTIHFAGSRTLVGGS